MSRELEKAVLICLVKDEKNEVINTTDVTKDLFPNMGWWYDKIVPFVESGIPRDLVVCVDILGEEITREIVTFNGSLGLCDTYLSKLKQNAYNERLGMSLGGLAITPELLLEGLAAYTPKSKDLNAYNLQGDLQGYVKELNDRKSGNIEWYEWGVPYMDRCLGKLRTGKMVVIKGLRKFGKTTFAVKLFSSFLQRKVSSIFISTEMGYYEIVDKMVALNTEINSFDILNGKISEDQMTKINEALANKISYKPGQIILCTNLTIDYIEKKIDETRAKVIFIDYLQMLQIGDIPRGLNHTQVLGIMASKLKNMCLKKNVSIVALSQVNSEGITKDAISVEEKADTILYLHERDKGIETYTTKEMNLSIMNRNGNSGVVRLIYCKQYGDFLEEEKENIPEVKDYKNIYQ